MLYAAKRLDCAAGDNRGISPFRRCRTWFVPVSLVLQSYGASFAHRLTPAATLRAPLRPGQPDEPNDLCLCPWSIFFPAHRATDLRKSLGPLLVRSAAVTPSCSVRSSKTCSITIPSCCSPTIRHTSMRRTTSAPSGEIPTRGRAGRSSTPARMGKFSSDRSIRDYCESAWRVQPGAMNP